METKDKQRYLKEFRFVNKVKHNQERSRFCNTMDTWSHSGYKNKVPRESASMLGKLDEKLKKNNVIKGSSIKQLAPREEESFEVMGALLVNKKQYSMTKKVEPSPNPLGFCPL